MSNNCQTAYHDSIYFFCAILLLNSLSIEVIANGSGFSTLEYLSSCYLSTNSGNNAREPERVYCQQKRTMFYVKLTMRRFNWYLFSVKWRLVSVNRAKVDSKLLECYCTVVHFELALFYFGTSWYMVSFERKASQIIYISRMLVFSTFFGELYTNFRIVFPWKWSWHAKMISHLVIWANSSKVNRLKTQLFDSLRNK